MNARPCVTWLSLGLLLAGLGPPLRAADQPQWGEAWSRNMVSDEKGLPDRFDLKTGQNVFRKLKLGSETHATPVIAGGRIFIGTNNGEPRDPKHQGDRGVLMCFSEKTGEFLWQLVVPKREEDVYYDWPQSGICSPVTVEGDRAYVVSNRGEVICLDVQGMANGNDGPFLDEGSHMTRIPPGADPNGVELLKPGPMDADIIWIFNLTTGAGIWSHDAAHSTIMIQGDYLYLNTGTGVDNTHKKIRLAESPSLVVLDKKTGRLLARENEHIAPRIFHNTWAGPTLGEGKGGALVFFAAGNGVVYAFSPLGSEGTDRDGHGLTRTDAEGHAPTAQAVFYSPGVLQLRKVWQFDFDPTAPKEEVHRYNSNRRESPSDFFGMPVFHGGRLYVAGGGDIWWGKNEAWLKCINPDGKGDITESGLVWIYPLQKHVMATPAVSDGLVYIGDVGRTFHCVDATTGKACWTEEVEGEVWASALVADGKVFIATRTGAFYVFAAGREKKLLSKMDLGGPISATPVAANGILYVTTMTHVFALKGDATAGK